MQIAGAFVAVLTCAVTSCGHDPGPGAPDAGTPATATITVARDGAGDGSLAVQAVSILCGSSCTAIVPVGTTVTVTASVTSGSSLGGWSGGGCAGTAATCDVTVDTDVTITKRFEIAMPAIEVSLPGSGAGKVTSMPAGMDCPGTCTMQLPYNTTVALVATPGAMSSFVGWAGACTGRGPCQVMMSQTRSVTAMFSRNGTLYTIDDASDRLQLIDPQTFVITDIGALGVSYGFGDCAWDSASSTMYMTDGRGTRSLYTLNLATGAATLVGAHGITDMFALGYHPPTDKLYGIAGNGNLYSFNRNTGAATVVGPTGNLRINGLVWDSIRNQLVAITTGPVTFYSVDVATGAMTALITGQAFLDNSGVTYDPALDMFRAIDFAGNVVQYDPSNDYARTPLASGKGLHTCLAHVPAAVTAGRDLRTP
jgi:hypothetical protein